MYEPAKISKSKETIFLFLIDGMLSRSHYLFLRLFFRSFFAVHLGVELEFIFFLIVRIVAACVAVIVQTVLLWVTQKKTKIAE